MAGSLANLRSAGGSSYNARPVSPARFMERLLSLELIRVTEAAAIASARLMGRGDTMDADRRAVEAMRRAFDEIPIDARVVNEWTGPT